MGKKFMSKICDFLKKCECFYVLTINKNFPAGRPFGAIMEYDKKSYISTSDKNEVHNQIIKNGNIQIIAKETGTRNWLRITGTATECTELKIKQKMLEKCPQLLKHFSSANSEHYLLFQIEILNVEFN